MPPVTLTVMSGGRPIQVEAPEFEYPSVDEREIQNFTMDYIPDHDRFSRAEASAHAYCCCYAHPHTSWPGGPDRSNLVCPNHESRNDFKLRPCVSRYYGEAAGIRCPPTKSTQLALAKTKRQNKDKSARHSVLPQHDSDYALASQNYIKESMPLDSPKTVKHEQICKACNTSNLPRCVTSPSPSIEWLKHVSDRLGWFSNAATISNYNSDADANTVLFFQNKSKKTMTPSASPFKKIDDIDDIMKGKNDHDGDLSSPFDSAARSLRYKNNKLKLEQIYKAHDKAGIPRHLAVPQKNSF